jgi:hypothetical protein
MDALLTEAMVCRQLDFNGHHLTERGQRHNTCVFCPPGDQDPGSANVLGVHRTPHPQRRRGNVAPELDVDSRALTPVDVFHCRGVRHPEFSAQMPAYQYRKWAIARCCRRLSKNI